MASSLTSLIVFLSGVIMGTGSTLTIKIIYGLEAVGLTGLPQKFEKPLTTTWLMFVAMMIAMPIHWVLQWQQSHRSKSAGLLAGIEQEQKPIAWKTYFLLLIPACFDLMGTALAQVGLLFCTVSVYQLVRCSVIIVTALLKVFIMKQKLSSYMWVGIFVNTVAMVLVSATSFAPNAASEGQNRDPRIGILFILLSCVVQGSQYVFEEKVMTVDNAPPLVVVGMEGFWGTLLMPLVVFPWAYVLPGTDAGGCLENFWDTFVMVSNSTSIQIVLALFVITVFFYNVFCIYVTFLLNSIWHAILDNFRPVAVWSTDLMLFYVFTHGRFGEAWTPWSWLELAGMVLLFIGTAIYNGTLRLPGYEYPILTGMESDSDRELIQSSLTPSIRTAENMSSPFLTSSPLLNQSVLQQRRHSSTGENKRLLPIKSSYGTSSRARNENV